MDIKPPQAQRAEKRHKTKKSSKDKRHTAKHKHRSRERYEKQKSEKYREDPSSRRFESARYVEYFQHPARPGRYDQHYYRDRENYGNRYRPQQQQQQLQGDGRKRYEKDERQRSPPTSRDRQQMSEADRMADEMLQDLRSKLLMKKSKLDEEAKAERRVERVATVEKPTEIRKEKKAKSRKNDQEPIEVEEAKSHKKSQKIKDPEDEELVARRARLLEADREMARRKEMAREELEARREMRRGKVSADDTSPQPVPRKRKRDKSSPKEIQEQQEDDDVVMVSDHSDEMDSESDSETSAGSDEEDVDIPHSPLSVGEISKSDRRKRHMSSRSASHSDRKPSRSLSPHSKSQSREESLSLSSEEHDSRNSRSRSRERSYSRDTSSRSHSRETDNEDGGSKTPEKSNSKPDPKKDRTSSEEKEKPDETPKIDDDLPEYFPAIQGCRSVEEFQCLNRIEEGTYGVVYRAKDKRTDEIVALKRLKMEKEKEGFPITSLREINTLLKGQHPNIVTVREIVVGSNMDKIFIVMDYVEHDLKSLMETMKHKKQFFLPGEVKCLLQQLLRAVAHLHDNWILHRDLKTSNLLLSHKGILKVGDFGLAREYGSPLKHYTPIVVTLWYRAPELLLCCKEYSTPIDVWSVGCIFAEFLSFQPLFPGKSEVDQLNRIFKDLGTPNEKIWPGYSELPAVQKMTFTEYPVSNLRKKFCKHTSELGLSLLQGLLTYDPKQRLSAEAALKSTFFKELPLPIDPAMFPTWPAKSELGLKKALASSPKPPSGGGEFKRLVITCLNFKAYKFKTFNLLFFSLQGEDANEPAGFHLSGVSFAESRQFQMGPGFSLKF